MQRSRFLPLLVALALVGASSTSSREAESAERAIPDNFTFTIETSPSSAGSDPAPATTLAPAKAEASPAATTTTVRPPDPHETFVATIRPEIEQIVALDEPDGQPVPLEFAVTNPTYFGNDLVLMVTERTADGKWLKVQIPVRPNGTEGWIPADHAELTSHFVRAEVNLTDRAVKVWDGDDLIAETGVVIGAAATPTPVGQFFVNDIVEKWDGSAYGPYILSLSGFSEAMETFGGGIPVIAIHGTNQPNLIGGAHSNGCIRIPNEVIAFLAENVPMGTPVNITA